MAQGKLAKFQAQTTRLRADNRELRGIVDELGEPHNPSTLRKFVGVGIKDGTAYGFTRLYVYGMQKGWMPSKVPVDLIFGLAGQVTTSFFEGPISSIFGDMAHGIVGGSLGRMATMHQLQKQTIGGTVCLVVPMPATPQTAANQAA